MKARIHTRNNGDLWYEVKANITGPIHFVEFININEEVTSKQELHRLNESKDMTLSILSHDLRSPLNTLKGTLQLARSLTEEKKNELLAKLENQVFQLGEFLDTTLFWTMKNFSELTPTRKVIDIKNVIDSILDIYTPSCDIK